MAKSARALVISDSHGDLQAIEKALDAYGDVDYIFHLGDYTGDAEYIAERTRASVRCVRGNCDAISEEPYFDEVVIAGQRIVLTHGHKLNAKYSTDRLYYYAEEHEAKAILYGHTHIPATDYVEGIWLINPGSVAYPRQGENTVAMLLINHFGVIPKILRVE